MSTWSSPVSASARRPGPTSSPASRRTRPNVTTCLTNALLGSSRLLEQAEQRLVANREQVLVVLEHRAERLLDHLRVELLPAERGERARPVDRLGDARRLREVEPAEPAHERGRLRREPLGYAGDAQPHDVDLALEARVPDPVVEAATLERVVQLPRSVRGEDDVGPPAGR